MNKDTLINLVLPIYGISSSNLALTRRPQTPIGIHEQPHKILVPTVQASGQAQLWTMQISIIILMDTTQPTTMMTSSLSINLPGVHAILPEIQIRIHFVLVLASEMAL